MQVLVQVNLDSELSEGAILPFSAEVLDSMKPAHGFLWTDGNLGFQAVLTYGYSAPDMDPPLTQAERKDRPYTRFMRLCPSRTYDDVFVPPANIALFLKASDESTIRDFLKTLDPVRIAELE